MPLLAGGLLELPLGAAAGQGRRRRPAILGGGVLVALTLAAVAAARSFAVLLCAFVAFHPASGAFVSLTQAELMDTWPDRQARVMARWELSGSAGAVAGPLLLAAAALLYPAFLLVPGAAAKLAVLAVLSAATAPWYPVLQARLYGSLPGRSPVAVTLSSAAGLAGGLGPLAVGLAAQGFGLRWALAGLAAVPPAVLLAVPQVPGRARVG